MRGTEGATVLVTGATAGLGFAVAGELARAGAHVLVHGRHPGRVETSVEALGDEARVAPTGYVADFARLSDVRRLAEEVRANHERLDVLINNAGIGAGAHTEGRQTSDDGHELRWQVNYLAPFLLSRMLLPLLRQSAPARIVNVASGAQQAIDFDDVMLEHGYDGWRAYSQSKLAIVADTFDLSAQIDPSEVTVNALHPASLMDTKMVRESVGTAQGSLDEGVDAVLRLAADPELDAVTGQYFSGTSPARAHDQAYDADARAALVRHAEALTGLGG